MSSIDRVAELKRQIAEHQASGARLEQELRHIARQESLKDGKPGSSKLSARSQSTAGYTLATPSMSQASFDDRAPKRQRRAMSQQSAQQMSRTASSRSETGPFRHTGASLQPLPAPNRPLPNVQQNEPAGPQSQEVLAMPNVGVRPDVFLAGLGPDHAYIPTSGSDLSPLDLTNTLPVSKCPSMVSGWSAGDGLTPMTRQNSFFGDSTMAGIDMSRWASESQSSRGFDDSMISPQGQPVKYPYVEHDFLGVGANLPADMTRSYSSSMQSQSLLSPPDSAIESTAMERSQSNESTSSIRSTASSKRRHKEALNRVIKASQVTPLAPKPHPTGEQKSKTTAPPKKEGKVAVPKNTYQRRKPVKVYCNQCSEHPDGFRGDHELRRHCLSKHEGIVKKFICRDPTTAGIATNLRVVKSLADCKQCRSEKPYGAYYNAAAHLRRQHFNPRVSRSKGKSDEKRGGKGGGDWPPMQELKAWFEERRVPANQEDAPDADQEENGPESADGDIDFNMEPYSLDNSIGSYGLGQMGDEGMLSLHAPVSSVDADFGLSQFANVSPVQGLMAGFLDDGSHMYGSSFSATNTITPSNLQNMSQIPLGDAAWNMHI